MAMKTTTEKRQDKDNDNKDNNNDNEDNNNKCNDNEDKNNEDNDKEDNDGDLKRLLLMIVIEDEKDCKRRSCLLFLCSDGHRTASPQIWCCSACCGCL